jgi:hypothetical protein
VKLSVKALSHLGEKRGGSQKLLLFFCNSNFLILLKPSPQEPSSPEQPISQEQKGRGFRNGLCNTTKVFQRDHIAAINYFPVASTAWQIIIIKEWSTETTQCHQKIKFISNIWGKPPKRLTSSNPARVALAVIFRKSYSVPCVRPPSSISNVLEEANVTSP